MCSVSMELKPNSQSKNQPSYRYWECQLQDVRKRTLRNLWILLLFNNKMIPDSYYVRRDGTRQRMLRKAEGGDMNVQFTRGLLVGRTSSASLLVEGDAVLQRTPAFLALFHLPYPISHPFNFLRSCLHRQGLVLSLWQNQTK